MPNIDQFESSFRAAAKERFALKEVSVETVLVITDSDPAYTESFAQTVEAFLKAIQASPHPTFKTLSNADYSNIGDLLNSVGLERPDLICTHRHLKSDGYKWSHSLGEYLDVVTQATNIPVLVLPHPQSGRGASHILENTDVVMAMTDQLAGDDWLVSYALSFTQKKGNILLTHIEDGVTFDRFIRTIGKIPSIDTDTAEKAIMEQLLDEPSDYIESCRATIDKSGFDVGIESIVRVGHHLKEYKTLIEEKEVDILIINTKDQHQMAMHGTAYAIAVEFRHIPLLML
jgi:hypothetical protein